MPYDASLDGALNFYFDFRTIDGNFIKTLKRHERAPPLLLERQGPSVIASRGITIVYARGTIPRTGRQFRLSPEEDVGESARQLGGRTLTIHDGSA